MSYVCAKVTMVDKPQSGFKFFIVTSVPRHIYGSCHKYDINFIVFDACFKVNPFVKIPTKSLSLNFTGNPASPPSQPMLVRAEYIELLTSMCNKNITLHHMGVDEHLVIIIPGATPRRGLL